MEKIITPPMSSAQPKEMVLQEQDPRAASPAETVAANLPDPTRYGDWERKGKCVDF